MGISGAMSRFAARGACFIVALLSTSGALALPPDVNLKQTLIQVLNIAPAQLVEARGFELQATSDVSGIVLGRYREPGTKWTFPVLGVLHACAQGTCLSILRLGQAAHALTPIALVDLEQPVASIGSVDPRWLIQKVREPTEKTRWPILILASDHQLQQPTDDKPTRTRGANEQIEQTLYFVSLRSGSAPKLLYQHQLLEKSPEPETRPAHRPPRVGRQIEGVKLGRQGQEFLLQIIERDIDSRFSECLRPEPITRRYRLVEDHFQEVKSATPRLPGDCP